MARTPLRSGWRVLMRAPAVVLAEIAWRWTFGVALCAILYYGFREYFATVEISRGEYAALRSLEPMTWMAITARVMVAIITGLWVIGPIVIPALVILWIALATIGRVATVRELADAEPRTNWLSTVGLHVFRVALAFAALLAFFGSGILIDTLVGDPAQNFAAVFLLASIALLVIAAVWSVGNWFFSLATIFTARDHAGFFRALRDTTEFYRRESGSLYGSGFAFGALRTILFIAVTIASLFVVDRFGGTHVRATVLLVAAISLAYFAVADGVNMWRLAAYIWLSEPEPPALVVPIQPIPPESKVPSVAGDPETVPPAATIENAPLEPTSES
jgi:hypothetical protein